MNGLLNRIFGIGDGAVGFGSPDAALGLVHALPAWAFVLVLAMLIVVVAWSYRAAPGPLAARLALGSMRVLALALLLLLALGPRIEQTTIKTEQDWALVLLDRSGSLATRDVEAGGSLVTRGEQLERIIASAGASWEELAQSKHVLWMGFADQAGVLSTGGAPTPDQIRSGPSRSTNIGAAIEAALARARARPVSSIVLVSDGRGFDELNPELTNRLASAQIPVLAVALGSEEPVRDIGITRVEYPGAVFEDDRVPVRVELSATSIDAQILAGSELRVELIDHATGEVLDSAPIGPEQLGLAPGDEGGDGGGAGSPWIGLALTPEKAGDRDLDVVIRGGPRSGLSDLNASNDRAGVRISVVDRPMRVLYIDGYPRWEQRYLKNLLLRERSITSSSMLLASSRRYVQEGDVVVGSVPSTLEEWEPFDVVILGDVRPELFSEAQLRSLLAHVTSRGAGVLWIAGPSANPGAWMGTALGALLPMRAGPGGGEGPARAWDGPVTMRSTDEAVRLGVLGLSDDRTSWSERLSDPGTGWSNLQWALALDEGAFKPGVSVLATASPVGGAAESPVVTAMRYGAGQSIFVGTDEIWRWRYGRGEDLPERFWLPLIRSLGRGTVDRRAAPAALTITPDEPAPDAPAQITLRVFDQARIDSLPDEVRVEIRSSWDADEPRIVTLRGAGDTRTGAWIPDEPGSYVLSLPGLDEGMSAISARVSVLESSDEQRVLDTDHALLRRLADETGGAMVGAEDFGRIPSMMPNRTRTIESAPKRTSLWDRPIVLIVLVLLLSAEWVGRRVLRLA